MSPMRGCPWPALIVCLLASALAEAASPRGFIDLKSERLRLVAGEETALLLSLPGGETWKEANLPRLHVRTFGQSWTVPVTDAHELPLRIDQPGLAMVILSAGPAGVKERRNSVELAPFCAKLLLRVEAPSGAARPEDERPLPSPDLTAKTGQVVELRPYLDPTRLNPSRPGGAVLPIRVYFRGASQAGARVTAHGPDGGRQVVKTDADGFTRVRIDRAGRWLLRHQHATRDGVSTGELIFEVESRPGAAAR